MRIMVKSCGRPGWWLALAALFVASHCLAEDKEQPDPQAAGGGNGAPASKGPELPGFVWIPPGMVRPGTTFADYNQRHQGNVKLKESLIYEVWGNVPPFPMPGFHFGRYEVTNAQWKEYLDKNFKVEHVTGKTDTLRTLAAKYIKFRGKGVEREWRAIYAFNWKVIKKAWSKKRKKKKRKATEWAEDEEEFPDEGEEAGEGRSTGEDVAVESEDDENEDDVEEEDEEEEEEAEEEDEDEEEELEEEESAEGEAAEEEEVIIQGPVWKGVWRVEDPPAEAGNDISKMFLPEGLKLVFYKARTPPHWYGWCKLAELRVGREYCDIRKPPAEAFIPPRAPPGKKKLTFEQKLFRRLKLRDTDFAAYPVRYVSPGEALAFAEWAGCELPSEFEFERAGRGPHLEWPYTFGPTWNHGAQKHHMAWADNTRSSRGPLRVDDENVKASDSAFGARHMLGNVWEQTRTFFDLHPRVRPKPPPPNPDVTNYGLIAKGGSFGDRWQMCQLSVRTGIVGEAWLDLRAQNRVDTLGLRLVSHPRPGYSLMLHSLLRIAYDRGAGVWSDYLVHAFAMSRMAGVDEIHVAKAAAPYVHFSKRATAIAFVPLFVTAMGQAEQKKMERDYKLGKGDRRDYFVLGALRSDIPLEVGRQYATQEFKDLRERRAKYAQDIKEWRKLPRKLQLEQPEPEKPPMPDAYEKATDNKNRDECGVWRGATIAPGEWLVIYWNGFLGLANKTLTMPPDAILLLNKKKIQRKRVQPAPPSQIKLHPAQSAITLVFRVEERAADKRKRRQVPREAESERWALCEASPKEWLGSPAQAAKLRPYHWEFEVTFHTVKDALTKHEWRETVRE
jgi:formylglycine-generating enzyme required for sulfatase activity